MEFSKLFIILLPLLSVCWANECVPSTTKVTKSPHCPLCQSSKNVTLKLDKLTIGNKKNTLYAKDFGEVCIKGEAKLPKGYITKNDTLDVRAEVQIRIGSFAMPLSCEVVYNEFKNLWYESDYDYDYDYGNNEDKKDEAKATKATPSPPPVWVQGVLNRLDTYNKRSCVVKDVCGLLQPGQYLREMLDKVIEENEQDIGLDFLDNFKPQSDNVCSVDFLKGKLNKMDKCYPIPRSDMMDLSQFQALAVGVDTVEISVILEIVKRNKNEAFDSEKTEHLLCLTMPLIFKFSDPK